MLSSSVEQELGQRAAQLGFSNARGAQENETAVRAAWGRSRPDRALRMVSATALMASSWPITRLCRCSSMWSRRSASPSISCPTGMPVQLDTKFSDVLSRSPPDRAPTCARCASMLRAQLFSQRASARCGAGPPARSRTSGWPALPGLTVPGAGSPSAAPGAASIPASMRTLLASLVDEIDGLVGEACDP